MLLDPALAPIVDVVLSSPAVDVYEAASADGSVRFSRDGAAFTVDAVDGRDPFAEQSGAHLAGLDAELADPHPPRSRNSYPFAFEQVAQLFDHPAAPDLCVVHSAAHNWEDAGGHRGEHGSLGVVQARAPFVLAGAGVRADGIVPRVARLVDVAPTICALLGSRPSPTVGTSRARTARCATDVVDDGTRARHVVGVPARRRQPERALRPARPTARRRTWRGSSRWDVVRARRDGGDADGHAREPHVDPHRSLPRPPRHPAQRVVRPPHAHAGHHQLAGHLAVVDGHCLPGVESIHDAIHRTWPDAFTASVNEPCDIGADYSTFDFFRRGEVPPIPEVPDGLPHVTERFVRPHKDYSWSSVVDHMGTEQAVAIWGGLS